MILKAGQRGDGHTKGSGLSCWKVSSARFGVPPPTPRGSLTESRVGGLFTHSPPEMGVPGSLLVGNSAFCTVPVPWTQGSGAVRTTVGSPRLLFPGSGLLASQVGSGTQLPGVHPGPPAQASPPTWRRSRSAGCEGPGRWDHQAADGAEASAASASHGGNGAGSQAHTGAHTPREA